MTFPEFLLAYRTNTLSRDAAWRAYDIPAAVTTRHVAKGLKSLKLSYAGELALPQFAALYGIPTLEEAGAIAGAWWVWSLLDAGRPVRAERNAGGGYPSLKPRSAAQTPSQPRRARGRPWGGGNRVHRRRPKRCCGPL